MAFTEKKGRFQKKNPYIDRRESKNREIKQALVHKARLKKKYFKALEETGESIPERQVRSKESEEQKKPQLSFQERQKLAKERKKQAHAEREKKRQEKLKLLEEKRLAREKQKARLSEKTKTGQPKMAPRINNLLDKIKKQYGADKS